MYSAQLNPTEITKLHLTGSFQGLGAPDNSLGIAILVKMRILDIYILSSFPWHSRLKQCQLAPSVNTPSTV